MRRSGTWISSVLLVYASACAVHYGFAGGGLPGNIHTMAVMPFDNQTASPDVGKSLYDEMHSELQQRLGVRDASQEKADALVRGVIQAYDADVPVGISANTQTTSARRRLQVTIDVEIVDQTNGRALFQRKGLQGIADYTEGQEASARLEAVKKLVNDIVEGAQSNW